MTAMLLTALFAAIAALAMGSIAASLHRYGAAALQLRRHIGECGQYREMRFRIVDADWRSTGLGATVLRPDFGVRAVRPSRHSGLRAAA